MPGAALQSRGAAVNLGGDPPFRPAMASALRLYAAIVAIGLAAGCGRIEHDMSPLQLAPPGAATPYAEDDDSTNRVLLAFTDLHAALRDAYGGRWEPHYYRMPADADWSDVRAHLDAQADAVEGWQVDTRLGNGYERRVWSDGENAVAAALVHPPASATDAPAVLMVLTPRD